MVSSMWREELIHPLIVHYPVALISVSLAGRIAFVTLSKRSWAVFLLPASRVLLAVGVAFAGIAILTGGLAEDVVNKIICDPTVTASHEDWAVRTALTSLVALVVDLGGAWLHARQRRASILAGAAASAANSSGILTAAPVAAISLHVAAAAMLIQTGHLGSSLVYQQGAAVYHPTSECKEFE